MKNVIKYEKPNEEFRNINGQDVNELYDLKIYFSL